MAIHKRKASADESPVYLAAAPGETFTGTAANDSYSGTRGDDFADLSQGGRDRFRGVGGSDYVFMGAALTAGDRIAGGNGFDAVDLDGDYSAGLTFSATTLTGVEQLTLAGGNSYSLTLNDGNVAALGWLTIFADFRANETVSIDGSAETDGDLILYSGSADDVLLGGGGNDLFRLLGGDDRIAGGAGIDRISFFGATVGVTVDLTQQGGAQETSIGAMTISGIEALSGTRYADVLTGTSGDNQIFAGGGNDRIDAARGDDRVIAGAGYDALLPTDARLIGGAGRDVIDLFANSFDTAGVRFDLSVTSDQDTGQGVFTASGFEDVVGTSFDDALAGDRRGNVLYGNAGGDRLAGGSGDDTLYGDGYLGIDRPSLTNGPDVLFEAADPGADTLFGGAGADVLTGGGGADTFLFTRLSDSRAGAADVVTDFARGRDVIDVSRIDADADRRGDQAFHLGETPGHAGDIVIRYEAEANRTTLAFHVDGDGVADMLIRLDGNHDLNAGDFIL